MTSAALPTPPPSTDQQPTGAPGRPGSPPLRRSTDAMLGGVCGGLAAHTGIDALIWRIGVVALTLAGGAGPLVYVLLWVLMEPPVRGPHDQVRPLDRQVERLRSALSGSTTPPRG